MSPPVYVTLTVPPDPANPFEKIVDLMIEKINGEFTYFYIQMLNGLYLLI